MTVCVCVSVWVGVSVRVCLRVRMRACVRACVHMCVYSPVRQDYRYPNSRRPRSMGREHGCLQTGRTWVPHYRLAVKNSPRRVPKHVTGTLQLWGWGRQQFGRSLSTPHHTDARCSYWVTPGGCIVAMGQFPDNNPIATSTQPWAGGHLVQNICDALKAWSLCTQLVSINLVTQMYKPPRHTARIAQNRPLRRPQIDQNRPSRQHNKCC